MIGDPSMLTPAISEENIEWPSEEEVEEAEEEYEGIISQDLFQPEQTVCFWTANHAGYMRFILG